MKIKMLKTVLGVKDGEINASQFISDNVYDLDGDLLNVFLVNNWAKEIKEIETKMDNQDLENKMLDLKVENKKGRPKKEVNENAE